jgi:hypothetical protein
MKHALINSMSEALRLLKRRDDEAITEEESIALDAIADRLLGRPFTVCPICSGPNSPADGGGLCFHCTCGFIQCAEYTDGPIDDRRPLSRREIRAKYGVTQ